MCHNKHIRNKKRKQFWIERQTENLCDYIRTGIPYQTYTYLVVFGINSQMDCPTGLSYPGIHLSTHI